MFGPMTPESSHERFLDRIEYDWKPEYPRSWWLRYGFWWLIHNVPAHLLIAFLPFKPCFDFHDWTSRKLNNSA